jgi:hypothetical protein
MGESTALDANSIPSNAVKPKAGKATPNNALFSKSGKVEKSASSDTPDNALFAKGGKGGSFGISLAKAENDTAIDADIDMERNEQTISRKSKSGKSKKHSSKSSR